MALQKLWSIHARVTVTVGVVTVVVAVVVKL